MLHLLLWQLAKSGPKRLQPLQTIATLVLAPDLAIQAALAPVALPPDHQVPDHPAQDQVDLVISTFSQDDFIKAWTNGKQFLPDPNVPTDCWSVQPFIKNAGPDGGITSKTELAMFMAEIMWESGGLYYKAELACKDNNCAGSYVDNVGLSGKYYYGRGYIQLTWELTIRRPHRPSTMMIVFSRIPIQSPLMRTPLGESHTGTGRTRSSPPWLVRTSSD